MMAPERDQAPVAATAPTHPAVSGPSQPGAELPDGRAPLRWPYTSRAQQERAQQAAAAAAASAISAESSDESDNVENNSDSGRENGSEVGSDSGESERSSRSSAQSGHTGEQMQAPYEAEPSMTQEALAARFAKMFAVGASEPVRSGVPAYPPPATRRLAMLAWAHVNGLTKEHVGALSASFGNFDRVVGAGRLVADAMGLSLIDIKKGLTVGLKVKYEAGKAVKNGTSLRRDAQKAAGKLPAGDPKRCELLSQAERDAESYLGETVDLKLGTPPPAAAARASGSRKRARAVEPTHEEHIAAAEAELLALQKAVKRAEVKEDSTAQTVEGKMRVLQRISDKSLACPTKTTAQMKRWKSLHACVQAALAALDSAISAQHAASVEHLEAQLAEKEASNQILQCEWAYAHEQWGKAMEALEARTA